MSLSTDLLQVKGKQSTTDGKVTFVKVIIHVPSYFSIFTSLQYNSV